ncbi:Crp/Fnr family transcriptional regulator [Limnohabitans sp. Rim47]|jgi:CRP-like cAMP-binding protein|uniref:Crp/Fnr family transcriptional regulator n=1 Tax=Limnohabitans sp. Rim47 TaxID=1100721 RepID=UPI0003137372|nr:Crp/Fnr family transcriptional regulator [Limnohabitans sp. Rim47]
MVKNPDLNQIISFLPEVIHEEWAPHFEPIDLEVGQILYEPGRALKHLYFPLTTIVSWVHVLENGSSSDVAIIGREGVIGIYLLMGASQTYNSAAVLKAGSAIRINLSVVLNSFNQGNAVQKVFLRFTQNLMTQMSQGAVCHRHHSLEQQLCRMLLMILDRQDGNDITMTHESMAKFLGVRREGVTQAARRLMEENTISYTRGHVVVLDRKSLEKRSCECYNIIKNDHDNCLQLNH